MKKLLLVLLLSVFAFSITSVSAFDHDTHRYIAEKTCENLNCSYENIVSECSVMPDSFQYARGFWGEVPNHFCFKGLSAIFGCRTEKQVDFWLSEAKKEDTAELKWCYIGFASHYFADGNCPIHQHVSSTWPRCHDESEELVGEFVKNETQNWETRMCGFKYSQKDLNQLILDFEEKVNVSLS